MAYMTYDGKPQPQMLARLQKAIDGKGSSEHVNVSAWDLRWALIRLQALEEFQTQVFGLRGHWSVPGGQSYFDHEMESLEKITRYSWVPGQVGRGKAIHVVRVIERECRTSMYTLCGAETCTTGHRRKSGIHTMKGYRVTCKRCLANMSAHPDAQETLGMTTRK